MSDTGERFGAPGLAAASGFSDSVYPIFYCDETFTVVDMNEAAFNKYEKFRSADMKKYLLFEDRSNIAALMRSFGRSYRGDLYAIARVHGTRAFTWVLAVPRRFFGKVFAEFRLYRTHREMLSSLGNRELMMPVRPKVPSYVFTGKRTDMESVGAELDEVFAYNMLSNIYSEAALGASNYEVFDIAGTTVRMVSEVSKAFKYNKNKWTVKADSTSDFAYPVVARKNYINIIALALNILSDISGDNSGSVTLKTEDECVNVFFKTKMKKPYVYFFGDFIFPLLGEMFEEVGARTSIFAFICNISKIGCYAGFDDDLTFTLHLTLAKDGCEEMFEVKHRKRFDTKSLREAIALVEISKSLK